MDYSSSKLSNLKIAVASKNSELLLLPGASCSVTADEFYSAGWVWGASHHRHCVSLLNHLMMFRWSRRQVEDMLSFGVMNVYWSVLVEGFVCFLILHTLLQEMYMYWYKFCQSVIWSFVLWCKLVFECIPWFELSSLIWRKWGTRSASSAYQASVLFNVGSSDIMEHTVQQGDT